jgi:hypothetical protein
MDLRVGLGVVIKRQTPAPTENQTLAFQTIQSHFTDTLAHYDISIGSQSFFINSSRVVLLFASDHRHKMSTRTSSL